MSREPHPFHTVLVVDDDYLVRIHAVDVLTEAGFKVLEAEDGSEALRTLDDNGDVEVLFTDINMPGMSGLDLAREVNRRNPAIHLILTSGAVTPDRDAIPDDGAFIPKPYSPYAVSKLMRQMLA